MLNEMHVFQNALNSDLEVQLKKKKTYTLYSTRKYLLCQASMLNPIQKTKKSSIQKTKKSLTERYLFVHLLRDLSIGGGSLLIHFLHLLMHSTSIFGYLSDVRSLGWPGDRTKY